MSVTLKNVTVSYDRHPAIHHVNGQFAEGSLTAVAGPNGGGKSTLLKAVAGLVAVEQGQITRADDGARLAYLPQAHDIMREFPISIGDFLSAACGGRKSLFGRISDESRKRADKALEAVGLEGFAPRSLQSLSAGQFQRVLFARVLLQDAQLILLDEPFTAVDEKTMPVLLRLIKEWHMAGRTVICVLHDAALIRAHFPQTLLIARDLIGWGPTSEVMSDDAVTRLQGFHEAWRTQAEVCEP